MDTQQQGTASAAAQTGTTGEQAATQQTQATQAVETAATTQQAQTSPSVEELTRQLAERDEKIRIATESARHWQSAADKERQRVQALAGTQPQADPLAEDIKFWVSRGYPEKEARDMVEFTASKMQPLISQNQALQQTVQATSRTGDALNYAMQDKEYAPLFQDPEIAMQVQQELQRCAMQGQGNMVTPEYAKAYAEQIWSSKNKPWLQQAGANLQAQPLQPRPFLGFNGPQANGYTPVGQPQQKASDPNVEALAQKMAQHMGHKLT